jgi:5'-3' exonuclease
MARDLPFTPKAFRQHVKTLLGDKYRAVTVVHYYPDYDHVTGDQTNGSTEVKKIGPKAATNLAVRSYREDGVIHFDGKEPVLPRNVKEVEEYIRYILDGDGSYCNAGVMTVKEYKAQQEKREREACEHLAAEVCAKYNVKGGTLKFIVAAHRYYDRTIRAERHFREDPEYKMERWATCIANGVTQGYWEDNDYSSSLESQARHDLERLIRYLQKYQPLLWGRWLEYRNRKGDGDGTPE